MKRAAAFLLSVLAAGPAYADPICADRPGQATGTCTVPAGHVQVETGIADWSLQKANGARETALALGATAIKFGIGERGDIGVGITPYLRSTTRDGSQRDRASGFGDVTLFSKQRLTADDAPVAVALLPFVKLPTARRSLGNRKFEAGLLLPVSLGIAGTRLSLGATPELDWAADGDRKGHHGAMTQVVSLGWSATDRLSLSGEVLGQWDWDPAGTAKRYSADGSVAYLVSDSVQIDAGTNLGLNKQTPDVELYAGISKRF